MNIGRIPAQKCVICQKTIEEVGGRRIVAQSFRGSGISKTYQGGGNKDYPYRSFKISDWDNRYLVVWGEFWTDESIQLALKTIRNGKSPWFCQKCGYRRCSECGEPINIPAASDVIDDHGNVRHCMIFPVDLGCINPKCKKYKDLTKSDDEAPSISEESIERPKSIYWVGPEEAEKIIPGKSRIKHHDRTGTITPRPEYTKYVNHGFWYADVKWDDGKVETFNLNKMGVKIDP